MQLYDVGRSPNCLKVRVIARELGLPLALVPYDFAAPKPPGYLDKNPMGKVPTLVDDDGFVLWESGAILVHLAEKKPESGLLPVEPHARAETFRWLLFAATHIQPWVSLLGQERLIKARRGEAPDPAMVGLGDRELARFWPVLEAGLQKADYLVGSYTIADIALGCGVVDCEARGIDLTIFPRITAWRERLRQRPAWAD
jgi:glutathione S-transferase